MPKSDLRNATPDEFAQFIFVDSEDEWFCGTVQIDLCHFAKRYTEMFSDPTFLLDQFNVNQLERGFWDIQSCGLPGNASEVIYDADIS